MLPLILAYLDVVVFTWLLFSACLKLTHPSVFDAVKTKRSIYTVLGKNSPPTDDDCPHSMQRCILLAQAEFSLMLLSNSQHSGK